MGFFRANEMRERKFDYNVRSNSFLDSDIGSGSQIQRLDSSAIEMKISD